MYTQYNASTYSETDGSAALQQSYDGRVMGSAFGAVCPRGAAIPQGGDAIKADTIPVVLPPDGAGLATIGTQAYKDTVAQTPVTAFDMQCCPNPAPCQEQVAWRAKWKGCPYTYFADEPALQVEVAPLGDRYWVADLNPLKYERSIMQQAEQNPYQFMQARQMWMQFLMKDWVQTKDPYTRPIANLDQTYSAQFKTQGPPRFTTF